MPELVKAAYEDALQPAAKQVGTSLETAGRLVNAALSPIRGLVWGWEQIESYISEAVGKRLKDVPEERIVTPSALVAGPALEALRFTGEAQELREFYANLLATSMDADTTRNAHPSFVEVIRQMTPDEARIGRFLSNAFLSTKQLFVPVVSVHGVYKDKKRGYEVRLAHFSELGDWAGCTNPELVTSYLCFPSEEVGLFSGLS